MSWNQSVTMSCSFIFLIMSWSSLLFFNPRTLLLVQATTISMPKHLSLLSGLPNTTQQPDRAFQSTYFLVSPFCSSLISEAWHHPQHKVQTLTTAHVRDPGEFSSSNPLQPCSPDSFSRIQESKQTKQLAITFNHWFSTSIPLLMLLAQPVIPSSTWNLLPCVLSVEICPLFQGSTSLPSFRRPWGVWPPPGQWLIPGMQIPWAIWKRTGTIWVGPWLGHGASEPPCLSRDLFVPKKLLISLGVRWCPLTPLDASRIPLCPSAELLL